MTITLYKTNGSPPCNFVRALAKHMGIELKLKTLDFAKKEHFSEEYLKINPFHKVPAIDDQGFVLYESNAIAYYLLRKYAPASELYPDCIETRTRIDQILASVTTDVNYALAQFVRPRIYQKTKPTTEEILALEENYVRCIELLIGDDKFAAGDSFTVADVTLTARLPMALESFVDPAKFPKLASYYKRVKREQPYFEEIYSPARNVIKEMKASLI